MNKIALFSVPRSGSSWLGEIFNSSPEIIYKFQPNYAYSFNEQLRENSNRIEITEFYKKLLACNDDFVNARLSISGKQRNFSFNKKEPTTLLFKETHYLNIIENLLKNSNTKVIGLVRSPFAVINSWLSIPREFNPEWELEKEWYYAPKKNQGKASHYFGYQKWKDATFLFLDLQQKYPERFFIINYDDLIYDIEFNIERLFKFSNIIVKNQTLQFIKKSIQDNNKDAYSVFKSKQDDLAWRNSLPPFIHSIIKGDKEFIQLNKIFKWSY